MFKNMGGNILSVNSAGGSLMGGNFPGGNFPGGSFPDAGDSTKVTVKPFHKAIKFTTKINSEKVESILNSDKNKSISSLREIQFSKFLEKLKKGF